MNINGLAFLEIVNGDGTKKVMVGKFTFNAAQKILIFLSTNEDVATLIRPDFKSFDENGLVVEGFKASSKIHEKNPTYMAQEWRVSFMDESGVKPGKFSNEE